MDCFKLEAETRRYLQKEQNNFNNIIQILSKISQIDDQIFSLFPINRQFQQIQQFIHDQIQQKFSIQTQLSVDLLKQIQDVQEEKHLESDLLRIDNIGSQRNKNKMDEIGQSQRVIQQVLDEKRSKSKRTSGKSIRSRKNEKDKIFEFESREKLDENNIKFKKNKELAENQIKSIKSTSIFDLFWGICTKKCSNRQQKYVAFLDLGYAYLKINQTYIKKQGTKKNTQQSKHLIKNELIQNQFLKYIKQSTFHSQNSTSIPILVKLCYRLKQIHEYINTNKDLITIRNMCVQMKNNIQGELPKQIIKQAHRSQFLIDFKQKNQSNKCMKSTYLNSLPTQISINNTIKYEQSSVNQKIKYQTTLLINNIQQVINKRLLDVDHQNFLWKYKNIKPIQSYSKIFLWRLDSCIVFINQILNKEQIYQKQQFVIYLKMGKQIRDSYVVKKINSPEQIKGQKNKNDGKKTSTHEILQEKTTKQFKTVKTIQNINLAKQTKEFIKNKHILQKMIFTYSNIAKYSTKLKESKYYNMLMMELKITSGYMFKISKNNNISKQYSNFQDFQLFIKGDFKENDDKKTGKKNSPKQSNKKVQFMGISNSKNEQKQANQKAGLKYLPINAINYEYILKQIQSEQIKNDNQTYKNYTKQDSYTQAQQNFLSLLQQNKRFNNFSKSLHYLVNKSTKTKQPKQHPKNLIQIGDNKTYRNTTNYHINLDGVVKDKICQFNTGKVNNKTPIRKKLSHQSVRSQQINYSNNGQNRNIIETYNKETGQVFGLAKRQGKKIKNSPQKNGKSLDNSSSNSIQLFKVKKRLGTTFDRKHSFKKQIINIISITKRNIKPSRYFNQIKDAQKNNYTSIISTEQRVTILSKQRLLDQISLIYQVNYEKPRPTLDQILLTPGSNTQKNSCEQEDSYSFKGIGISTCTNISLPSKKFELTMIQSFGKAIGFLNIKVISSIKTNEYQIGYTNYSNRLVNQKVIISTINNVSQIPGIISYNKNYNHSSVMNRQEQVLYKSTFTLEQLKKQIINSQFYFELIQENIDKNIPASDIYMIHEYFNYLQAQSHNNIPSHNQLITKNPENEIFNPTAQNIFGIINTNTNSLQKNFQEKQKSNKIQSIIFAFTQRISHSLLYWYYTKGVKINGSILLKRQIPFISDPLKFAIALDFMKKYTHKQCLEKLSNVRNKKALYECFRYLFYGRKIIVKGFLLKKSIIYFYTLSLQKFFDSNFKVRTKQQGGSQFRDLSFIITLYNQNGQIQIQKREYPVSQILSSKQITLVMLNNIIQQQINPKYIESVLMDIQMRQSSPFYEKLREPYWYQFRIVEQNCQQYQSSLKSKIYNQYSLQSCIKQLNQKIKNYGNLLFVYTDIISGPIGFKISNQFKKVIKVQSKYYLIQEIFLVCGLVLHIISSKQNKNKILHITIYELNDIEQLHKKIKYKKTNQIHKQIKQIKTKCEIQSEGEMRQALMKRQKRNSKKIVRTLSNQNYLNKNCRKKYQQQKQNENKQQNDGKNEDGLRISEFMNAYQCKFPNICKNINQSFLQYNPQFKNRKSSYHSRIVIPSPNSNRRNLINKIKKSIIQKEEMDFIQMINQSQEGYKKNREDYINIKVKRIIRIKNNYLYFSIIFNKFINAYRIDFYQASSSNKFSTYFRLQQYQINQQFITNFFQSQKKQNYQCQSQSFQFGSNKKYYDTYYNHNYFEKSQIKQINILKQQMERPVNLVSHNEIFLNGEIPEKSNSMIFSSTQTLNIRQNQNQYKTQSCLDHSYNRQQYDYLSNPNKIGLKNLFLLYLFNYKKFTIREDLKSLTFVLQQKNKSIKIPLFPTFNNLSSFQGRNQGKIELIQINSRLYLLIIFQNNPNLYICEVDDNPYMNNINLFADFKAKEHLVNLYTDLFMRMSVKFEGSTLTGRFYQKIRDIGNL